MNGLDGWSSHRVHRGRQMGLSWRPGALTAVDAEPPHRANEPTWKPRALPLPRGAYLVLT